MNSRSFINRQIEIGIQLACVVRSYIFLLLQPSLDLKMSLDEHHSNLGCRLAYATYS